jgi:hypothetical protein
MLLEKLRIGCGALSAGTSQLDNLLSEGILLPLSRTYDFFILEGSPTELAAGFQINQVKSVFCHTPS